MTDSSRKQTKIIVRRALNRVMGSLASRKLPAPTQDGRDTARRVLRSLFARSGHNAIRLREAMLTSREATRHVLARLNAQGGRRAGDPHFSDDQIASLQLLLFDSRFAPMAPVVASGAGQAAGLTVQKEVLRFWTELLSKKPSEVEDFHYRITDYWAKKSPAKLERVLDVLHEYAPQGTWTRDHADALAAINTTHIQFKSLAWIHFPGVLW
ncbi:MAG TPA: hypothetical protein VND93_21035 [Myxococcales bacterium]|nr:hypothetical protein [Myxococcales bacterium]